jgi:GNAT superfamily N-acetyltransferase
LTVPILREMTPGDASLVARLTREAWAGIVAPDSSGHRESEERVLKDLAHGGGLVMEIDGQAVGSVRWHAEPFWWTIMRLGIVPPYRGRGLSTWLTNEVLMRAARAGVQELRLAVRTDQPALLKYYERLGFTVDRSLDYPQRNPHNPAPLVLRRPVLDSGPRMGVDA